MRLGKLLSVGEVVEDEAAGQDWSAPVEAVPVEAEVGEPAAAAR